MTPCRIALIPADRALDPGRALGFAARTDRERWPCHREPNPTADRRSRGGCACRPAELTSLDCSSASNECGVNSIQIEGSPPLFPVTRPSAHRHLTLSAEVISVRYRCRPHKRRPHRPPGRTAQAAVDALVNLQQVTTTSRQVLPDRPVSVTREGVREGIRGGRTRDRTNHPCRDPRQGHSLLSISCKAPRRSCSRPPMEFATERNRLPRAELALAVWPIDERLAYRARSALALRPLE
jgi:hypothetical protein